MEARHRLTQWIEDVGVSQAYVARKLGVTRAAVNNWCRGHNRPNLCKAIRLEQLSGGAVPARTWVERDDVETT